MTEPTYIRQTFEPEHVANDPASSAWIQGCVSEAKKEGCTFPRVTVDEGGRGILFEAWIARPDEQGPARWSVAPTS